MPQEMIENRRTGPDLAIRVLELHLAAYLDQRNSGIEIPTELLRGQINGEFQSPEVIVNEIYHTAADLLEIVEKIPLSKQYAALRSELSRPLEETTNLIRLSYICFTASCESKDRLSVDLNREVSWIVLKQVADGLEQIAGMLDNYRKDGTPSTRLRVLENTSAAHYVDRSKPVDAKKLDGELVKELITSYGKITAAEQNVLYAKK